MTHPDRAELLATIRAGKVARVNGLVAGSEAELDHALSHAEKKAETIPAPADPPVPEPDGLEEDGVTVARLKEIAAAEDIELKATVKAEIVAEIRAARKAKETTP